jgi:hypothetical protein
MIGLAFVAYTFSLQNPTSWTADTAFPELLGYEVVPGLLLVFNYFLGGVLCGVMFLLLRGAGGV